MQRKVELKLGGETMSLSADLSCLQGSRGAEREAALESLEKQLICPICLEIFNKPVVILPCQHNLCRKCANELYQPSLFQARTTMLVNSGRFRCPSCRQEVVLDRHGVYGLQRNLLVENIIDVYKQEVSSSNAPSPSPLPPPAAAAAAQVTCSEHEGEKVNIYCLSCQVPTCSLCKVFGAHQSCQVAPLTDVYQQRKDELSEGISALTAFSDKVQTLINELEESCRNVEENYKTQKQNVCDKFSRMFSILEERQKAMTQRISAEQDEKMGHVQALVRCYGNSVDANNKLVEGATSSMEEPDMAAFVQNSRELIAKVIAATGSCSHETLKPGYENLSHYRFNFSRQERALRSLDFIKVVEDVPEEPEVDAEPEEPKEPSIQNTEVTHYQETSVQNLEYDVEPVKEAIPALISPPLELPPAPGLVRDSVDLAGEVMQPETEEQDSNHVNPGQIKVEKQQEEEEEELEEDEDTQREVEGCATPESVKEEIICDEQDGMSTQQCEKGDVHEMPMKEGIDPVFYPSWHKAGSWKKDQPVLPPPEEKPPEVYDAEQMMRSTQPTGAPILETKPKIEADGAIEATSEPQIQQQRQDSQLLPEGRAQTEKQSPSDPKPELLPFQHPQHLPLSTLLHAMPYIPLPQAPHRQPLPDEFPAHPQKIPGSASIPGEAGVTEEEEEDALGWECQPGEDGFPNSNGCMLSTHLERDVSEMDEVHYELSDVDKKEQNGDIPALKGSSEVKERDSEEDEEEGGADERSEELVNDLVAMKDGSEVTNGSLDVEDGGVGSTNNLIVEDRGGGFNAGRAEIVEREDGENPNVETSVAESEEKMTSPVSLQAVTLLFYLLAFLVILQRVWAYIGCFICT